MQVAIREIGVDQLATYAHIPIVFEVGSELRVDAVSSGFGGLLLTEHPLEQPYVKDYDGYAEDENPTGWPRRFDVSNWAFFLASGGDEAMGGAAVAYRTPGLHMLEGREDLAVLWDIRVRPEDRRKGVGTRLFQRAAAWAKAHGCTQLKVETQNVNVPACRFYVAQGCRLGAIHRYAYAGCPPVAREAMLLWYLGL